MTRLRGFAEEWVKIIYKEEKLPRPPQADFFELLDNNVSKNTLDSQLLNHLHIIRRVGNQSAHGKQVNLDVMKNCLKTAYQLGLYIAVRYQFTDLNQISAYKEPSFSVLTSQQNNQTAVENEKLLAKIAELEAIRLEQARQIEMLSTDDLALRRQQSQQVVQTLKWDEATTRRNLIDVMLAEAGWSVADKEKVSLEYPLDNFAGTASGKGKVDYVLWDNNGKPLAVLEAKKTSVSVLNGQEQARLYADALEQKFGQRPILFY